MEDFMQEKIQIVSDGSLGLSAVCEGRNACHLYLYHDEVQRFDAVGEHGARYDSRGVS